MTTWNVSQTGRPDLTETVRSSVDLIAARIDNVEAGLSGTQSLDNIQITGGSIDGTPVGITTPDSGKFTDIAVDNIEIDGNIISSSSGDIEITPNSGGTVKISGITDLFGTWDTSTYVKTTIYKADTDLIVCAYCDGFVGANDILAKTDSSATPATIVAKSAINMTNVGIGSSSTLYICFPVKKGDYWQITTSYTPTIRVLPFGA